MNIIKNMSSPETADKIRGIFFQQMSFCIHIYKMFI